VMSNQVVLISTAEKSLRLTHSVLPSPWKDLSVVLCYRRYFDDDVIAANRLPTSMFTMQCGLRPFSSTARLVTLSIPGYGSSSCRRLPTSMSAQKCGPQGRSAPDSHSAYPRRHNHLQTMTDQCGVFADHNQASALFRSTLQLFSFLLVFSIPAISSFSPSLLPSLPPTSSHQPQPFPFPLPKRSNTLQSDMRQTSQTYPPFLPSSSFSTPDFCRLQEPTPSGRPTPNPCEAPATRT
jgi:hypothetical protein